MSDAPTKLLDERIAAMIHRVKTLAAEREAVRKEREAVRKENELLRGRIETHERENARLRTVLEEAARELRQE